MHKNGNLTKITFLSDIYHLISLYLSILHIANSMSTVNKLTIVND
jgi:hypothetical protein